MKNGAKVSRRLLHCETETICTLPVNNTDKINHEGVKVYESVKKVETKRKEMRVKEKI